MRIHNVNRLAAQRLADSSKPFNARGGRLIRCDYCMLGKQFCICEHRPLVKSSAGFMLVMFDYEMIKPSNTGRLIADVIEDTFAYKWSRTEPNQEMIDIIQSDCWQPFIIFPEEYVVDRERVHTGMLTIESGKRPLYILLDGSWREAKKMFRKSPYLDRFPMVSFDAKTAIEAVAGLCQSENNNQLSNGALSPVGQDSRYTVRKTELEHQFSTAEVGARVLAMHGETNNAHLLDLWFDVFNFQYQKSVCQRNKGNVNAMENYQSFLVKIYR